MKDENPADKNKLDKPHWLEIGVNKGYITVKENRIYYNASGKNYNFDPLYSYLKTLYHRGYMEYIQNQTTGIKNLLLEEFYKIQVIQPKTKKTRKDRAEIL